MKKFTILLGGTVLGTKRLQLQLSNTSVIAADHGIRHAAVLNLKPELWVGDFDSTQKNILKNYSNIPKISFPPDKDKTDGEIAVNAALERGAEHLVLCGAFGGKRTDHVLYHMTIAIKLALKGIPTLLTSGYEEGWPLTAGHHTFDFSDNIPFSIVAFSKMKNLSINGAKWSLYKELLDFGSSWTLSNQVQGTLSVVLKQGKGILLARPKIQKMPQ
ncbi:MAG: thiamine pyrophosphokinase [Candidatus Tokpelaia sp. JSC161]|nr:MAG: thiamine pyrophosphokinase [Candidatus Tokpelaia sp. JSC161]